MGIKRGVSLYSYQQNQFFRKMTWKDMLREVATNLDGATGIEIISEATVQNYPFPAKSSSMTGTTRSPGTAWKRSPWTTSWTSRSSVTTS